MNVSGFKRSFRFSGDRQRQTIQRERERERGRRDIGLSRAIIIPGGRREGRGGRRDRASTRGGPAPAQTLFSTVTNVWRTSRSADAVGGGAADGGGDRWQRRRRRRWWARGGSWRVPSDGHGHDPRPAGATAGPGETLNSNTRGRTGNEHRFVCSRNESSGASPPRARPPPTLPPPPPDPFAHLPPTPEESLLYLPRFEAGASRGRKAADRVPPSARETRRNQPPPPRICARLRRDRRWLLVAPA